MKTIIYDETKWQLVPKFLTEAMAEEIRKGADNRRYISWPASCWEGALEVAPAIPEQHGSDARDAARYRWLRDTGGRGWIPFVIVWEQSAASCDASVDAAMAKGDSKC